MSRKSAKLQVGLLCGGPSLERGISLNSARSVMDHLESEGTEIVPFYIDAQRKAYAISKAQLYSNTPSDFDFKLHQTSTPLTDHAFVQRMKKVDIIFPAMHGQFGEDGGVQHMLETHNIPFIGSPSASCKKAFDKFNANAFISTHGFFTLPSLILKIYHTDHAQQLKQFFAQHNITRAVVKPASGGSSIGVFSVATVEEALKKAQLLFSKRMDTRIVIEPFAEGSEFTIILLENRFGLPVALPPTEIETDYTEHQFFDFRRKYLPTRQVTWHCPPRFDAQTIERIQAQAEQLFALFGMHDFARFDGWVLPDGRLWFCDFNPISGMEQNSFLFQQASRIGMTHHDVLQHILMRACARFDVRLPRQVTKPNLHTQRTRVNILMGGNNSERQVSLMSGTNVWLKLRDSTRIAPQPYLLDADGTTVWHLPYHLCLNHTVEEISENCTTYQAAKATLASFEERARLRLGLQETKNTEEFFEPRRMTLEEFIAESTTVFIALHGGTGEDGTLQQMLDTRRVRYNGSPAEVSRLCMDKWDTSRFIDAAQLDGVRAIPGAVIETAAALAWNDEKARAFWKQTRTQPGGKATTLIVKPRADGCTTGIAHLATARELRTYLQFLRRNALQIPPHTFRGQLNSIEMPPVRPTHLLFETYIETDVLRVKGHTLKHTHVTGWIEVTVGVVERSGVLTAFNPSITVVEGEVLTVEEKFQGGTGVNITPPPSEIISPRIVRLIKQRITRVAERIGIRGYARIDAFVHVRTGNVLVIEVNTLPGLTPSTVFYHQALAEDPPLFPRELLEMFIHTAVV